MFFTVNEKDPFSKTITKNLCKKVWCSSCEDAVRKFYSMFPMYNKVWNSYGRCFVMYFPNVYLTMTFFG